MLIDMHVHTSRYSACSILDPATLIYRAQELKLSGVAITEHYNVWTKKEIKELKQSTTSELVILRGREISSAAGHLLVFGYYSELDKSLPILTFLNKVRSAGGIVIMAHPFRYGSNIEEVPQVLKNKFSYFDGVEIFNGNQTDSENEFAKKIWLDLGLTGVGGSDAHSFDMVGKYVTLFENDIKDEEDFITEIKFGRCRPVNYLTYLNNK